MPLISVIALATTAAAPAQALRLRAELSPFAFLLGRCWRGTSPDGKPDTHCFSAVFDGQHVRDTHEVPGKPPYRGETLYSWNSKAGRIEYAYWNSFGDVYRGSAAAADDGIAFSDLTNGAPVSIRWRRAGAAAYVVEASGRAPIRFVHQTSAPR